MLPGVANRSFMTRVRVAVPAVTTTVWLTLPVTVTRLPPIRRFVITEFPEHKVVAHEHAVVDDTVFAVMVSAGRIPPTAILSVSILAVDWLVLRLPPGIPPEVVTVDVPTAMTFGTTAEALCRVIEPPALGSGPVSLTPVVKTGRSGTLTVDRTAAASPLYVCAFIEIAERTKKEIKSRNADL
jgi:hypothetical protein